MLNTNICIYVMKNRVAELRERFDAVADMLCISSITPAELHDGAEKSARRPQNLQAIAEFTAQLEILDFSAAAATRHGQLRAELERLGQVAGPYDMLIGGHARSAGLIVVTNNVRKFARMPGVRVENWVQ
jgi:tRNA(fMet)-specific endonuclease VapC